MAKMNGLRRAQLALLVGALAAVQACSDSPAPEIDKEGSASNSDDDESGDKPSGKDNEKDDEPDDGKGPKDDEPDDKEPPKTMVDAGKGKPAPDSGVPKPAQGDGGKGTPTQPNQPGATGPDDGDPSKPVVAIDIPCGGPSARGGLGMANLQVGGRDVILTYPCEKHEGANVTFILNLHGTNANEASKAYTHRYFAAHTLASSHNLIVATPKSRASQWGNTGENPAASEDKPHLLDVIKYVYDNFEKKFNITSMWVVGHSWGAMYAKRFVCDETIKDKARGVVGMSGGATAVGGRGFGTSGSDLMSTANCADYISQIHTMGDMDSVAGLPDQTAAATKHGCGPKGAAVDLGEAQMAETWPDCDPGWVHENITMGGHTHTTSINPPVVKHIVELIKATEKH